MLDALLPDYRTGSCLDESLFWWRGHHPVKELLVQKGKGRSVVSGGCGCPQSGRLYNSFGYDIFLSSQQQTANSKQQQPSLPPATATTFFHHSHQPLDRQSNQNFNSNTAAKININNMSIVLSYIIEQIWDMPYCGNMHPLLFVAQLPYYSIVEKRQLLSLKHYHHYQHDRLKRSYFFFQHCLAPFIYFFASPWFLIRGQQTADSGLAAIQYKHHVDSILPHTNKPNRASSTTTTTTRRPPGMMVVVIRPIVVVGKRIRNVW